MDLSTVTTRTMTVADVAGVSVLEVASFEDPWPPAMFFEELGLDGREYVVVEDRGRLIAYGGIMRVDDDAHIMTIAVDPSRRRQGVGRRLMLALIETALERGARHLTLEVRATNEAARRLYEEFGFDAVGRRPRYYRDEDAIIMWAVDADQPAYRRRLDEIRERS